MIDGLYYIYIFLNEYYMNMMYILWLCIGIFEFILVWGGGGVY